MSNSPTDRCGYTWPVDHEKDDLPYQQSCCIREKVSDEHELCIWHVKPNEVSKSARELRSARERPETRQQNSPYAELLDGANLAGVELVWDDFSFKNVTLRDSNLPDANLRKADFSGANLLRADLLSTKLWGSDLSGAKLWEADLSDADLRQSDLSGSDLLKADLSGANLFRADLPDAKLYQADLPDAKLYRADLSGAFLVEADLSGADLRDANLPDAKLNLADLSGADLSEADLSGGDYKEADLSGAVLREADLSGANLQYADLSGVTLNGADLSGADLSEADLSGVNLIGADLPDAKLVRANLSDANPRYADLSEADLLRANLSNADLTHSDLSGANLRYVDLSSADLRDADLSGADLSEVVLENVSVNGATTCRRVYEGYGDEGSITKSPVPVPPWLRRLFRSSEFDPRDWDAVARAYHNLKTVFNDHGLIGKAREKHVQERRARSLEAKTAGGWINRRYLGSLPSRIFTGYGVQVRHLLVWMVALFLVSTAVYVSVGVKNTILKNISYSVLAFTVAPPPPLPSGVATQLIMMTETFFGTLSIVLLGYILSNRERF